ncbi:hypothetical protein C8F04DRAFT_1271592 [Mycena alexandri]|uniref:Uncharacterized protein n=1 Tax=Mycena alexandri TaxID=1745969 RepID=A0AAD6WQE8_9AGAR|nr:hypothetical protein C8F04DRAFT_1271592 [Mycena alexandri]
MIGDNVSARLLPVSGSMHLERLSIDIRQLFHTDTDTDTDTDEEQEEESGFNNLSTLPALTHLAFSSQPNPEIVGNVLRSCPKIQILVIAFSASEAKTARRYAKFVENVDGRLVVATATYADYSGDWEMGARGGEDIWVRAEKFIAAKKRGDIEDRATVEGEDDDD